MASCKINYDKAGKIESVNAPNGAPSKLFDSIMKLPEVKADPEVALSLYAQVYTPQFREWFGDWEKNETPEEVSKVVDENGEPLLVYHGTDAQFDTFKLPEESRWSDAKSRGLFFTPIAASNTDGDIGYGQAEEYGDIVMPVFLNMRNPEYRQERDARDGEVKPDTDGIIGKRFLDDEAPMDRSVKTFVVNDPSQVKSAFNYGAFKKTEDNIFLSANNLPVDATLKIMDALTKTPRRTYPSNHKEGFYNDLRKHGATAQQIEMLKQYIEANNIGEINTEDLLTSFKADVSYTIEIERAEETASKSYKNIGWTIQYDSGKFYMEDDDGRRSPQFDSEAEANDWLDSNTNRMPTTHYSNLTAPGGTNYTENRIITPEITPNIKGHAAFAGTNDIGWFRSDDKVVDGTRKVRLEKANTLADIPNTFTDHNGYTIFRTASGEWMGEKPSGGPFSISKLAILKLYNDTVTFLGTPTKTRRILEVQSDLFQKGRGKDSLLKVDKYEVGRKYFDLNRQEEFTVLAHDYATSGEFSYEDNVFMPGEDETLKIKYEDGSTKVLVSDQIDRLFENVVDNKDQVKGDEKKDKFLQVLNKDNTWVTVFIKSIIQDSAKRGYETVRFPTGDTASKIEGHTTLEQFKKDKETRIKSLEATNEKIKNGTFKANLVSDDPRYADDLLERNNNEIAQLKQEIERVDSEGIAALKPIYNFYENNVYNILKKRGYAPNRVTDEFGNDWFEVPIDTHRDLATIFFQGEEEKTQSSKASEPTLENVRKFLRAIGIPEEAIHIVTQVTHNGQSINAIAMADMINRTIQIARGKEGVTLPEEAMHFLVAIVKVTRPELYRSLIANVRDYKIYKELINSEAYTQNKNYRNQDGTLNIEKIKEEAVAKVLAEYLIDGLEGVTEKPELMAKAGSWWSQVLNWIMSFFGKVTNPFETVVQDLIDENYQAFGNVNDISVSNGVFLSATTTAPTLAERDAQFADSEGKKLYDSILNRTKQLGITKVDDKYYLNGEQKTKRVSDLVQAYYNELFRNKIIPEEMKPFYEQTRIHGTYVHEIMEDVMDRIIDPATGLVRDKFGEKSEAIRNNPLAAGLYDYLAQHLVQRIGQYPLGTRFLFEQVIYDPNKEMFGTVDFIAIQPDGTTDILDWKTLYYEEYAGKTGVKDFKKEAFNIQIKAYKNILKEYYGIPKFRYLRAIPLKKVYRTVKDAQGKPTNDKVLTSVQIGSANPLEIEDPALRPVIISDETTGDKRLDEFIDILEQVASDLKTRKGKFDANIYELLSTSIYDLRVGKGIDSLYRYSIVELAEIRKVLAEVEKNSKSYKNETVNDVLADLNYYHTLIKSLENVSFMLRDNNMPKDQKAKLDTLITQYERARDHIDDVIKSLTDKVANTYGIFSLLKPEKVMQFYGKWMRNMSQQQSASIQLLYKMVNKVFNKVDLQTKQDEAELYEKRDGVKEWAKRNNVSMDKALKHLLQYNQNGEWNGNMISVIDKAFYKERDAIIKSGDKNTLLAWWAQNYDVEAYAKWYNDAMKAYQQELITTTYSEDAEVNRQTKEYLAQQFLRKYNITLHPMTAFGPHNREAFSRNIKEEKWHSEEYKFLLKPENKELLDAYNHFRSINKELIEEGVIDAWKENTFVPSVRRGFAETFSFEQGNLFKRAGKGLAKEFVDFKESLKIDDKQVNFSGYINPMTGRTEEKLFALYTAEIGEWTKDAKGNMKLSFSNKSADLFTVYALMNRQKNRYKYLSQVENIAQALRHVEASKGSIETSVFGKVQKDAQGDVKVNKVNTSNLEMLDKHIAAAVYGRVIQNKADALIPVTWNKFADAWNKSMFGKWKQLKKKETDRTQGVSASKVLMMLNRSNVKRILGVNLRSAISNLFGGTASTFLLEKKYFTDKDLGEAAAQIISGSWYATEDMKKRAALVDYFLPLLENRLDHKAFQLSASKTVKILSTDWIMSPMTKSEHVVQLNIFLATLANTMVENGELVNIRQFVQKEMGWDARFNMTSEARKKLEKEMEKRIEKLKEERGVVKHAQFKTIKRNGKDITVVDIPGIDRNSTTVEDFREKVHSIANAALGSSTEFDLAAYKYNMWARLLMTFKNWIPRQADVRFGEFRYDAATDQYEWGRARMFFRGFTAAWMNSALKLIPFLGRGVARFEDKTYLINRAKEIYKEKMDEQKSLGLYDPRQFISEADFIESFLKGVDSEFTELRTITILMSILLFGMLAAAPGDDKKARSLKALAAKQLDKLTDELSFFYSPRSFVDVVGSKPLPIIGLFGDMFKFVGDFGKEVFGMTFNVQDGKWEDQAKPTKSFFKLVPVAKEFLGYLPVLDPEMAKEMGITIQPTNNSR